MATVRTKTSSAEMEQPVPSCLRCLSSAMLVHCRSISRTRPCPCPRVAEPVGAGKRAVLRCGSAASALPAVKRCTCDAGCFRRAVDCGVDLAALTAAGVSQAVSGSAHIQERHEVPLEGQDSGVVRLMAGTAEAACAAAVAAPVRVERGISEEPRRAEARSSRLLCHQALWRNVNACESPVPHPGGGRRSHRRGPTSVAPAGRGCRAAGLGRGGARWSPGRRAGGGAGGAAGAWRAGAPGHAPAPSSAMPARAGAWHRWRGGAPRRRGAPGGRGGAGFQSGSAGPPPRASAPEYAGGRHGSTPPAPTPQAL